eukprot:TRINITY_DN1451_c3_g1_i2.p1 TRINITY_DN1451_c3_g1~~TRINITY_DN1451_c3_g1_i2.p1  ORF type:complete len:339 (+),score=46.92 TRINITY_DN1451_c3_g1_i2:65-1018(+)
MGATQVDVLRRLQLQILRRSVEEQHVVTTSANMIRNYLMKVKDDGRFIEIVRRAKYKREMAMRIQRILRANVLRKTRFIERSYSTWKDEENKVHSEHKQTSAVLGATRRGTHASSTSRIVAGWSPPQTSQTEKIKVIEDLYTEKKSEWVKKFRKSRRRPPPPYPASLSFGDVKKLLFTDWDSVQSRKCAKKQQDEELEATLNSTQKFRELVALQEEWSCKGSSEGSPLRSSPSSKRSSASSSSSSVKVLHWQLCQDADRVNKDRVKAPRKKATPSFPLQETKRRQLVSKKPAPPSFSNFPPIAAKPPLTRALKIIGS